jgi:hypothetical protein
MSEPASNPDASEPHNLSREEMMSALFAHLVIQNTNMTLMLLGQVPHPETGERMHDFEAAKMFIDQLEMLEVKTRGNLTREEEKLLQQSLTHLRLTFVQAIENPPQAEHGKKAEMPAAQPISPENPPIAAEAGEDEPRKRFSKKF